MLRIDPDAWRAVIAHVERAYPEECCGAMLGTIDAGVKSVNRVIPLENVFQGDRTKHYEISQEHLRKADRIAHEAGLQILGIYHSHPDRDAHFSDQDLRNSWPWYSFVVLSVIGGTFGEARAFIARDGSAEAEGLSF